MRRCLVTFAAIPLAFAVGCGSDSTSPIAAPCTVTITGAAAIAGTYTCTQTPSTIFAAGTNLGAFALTITGTRSITGTVIFTGAPSTSTTYAGASSSSLPSYAFVVNSGTASWEFTGGLQLGAPLGSFTLEYSSIAVLSTSASGTAYTAHGTLDANLVPGPGTTATGTATMHVAF